MRAAIRPVTPTGKVGPAVERVVEALMRRAQGIGSDPLRLGDEASLASHYSVNRKTVRTAVRELERQGVVRVQNGCRGGVMVVRPPFPKAERALIDHLILSDLPMTDIVDVANRLLVIGAELIATRSMSSSPALRRFEMLSALSVEGAMSIEDWTRMRLAFAAETGNPALALTYRMYFVAYAESLSAEPHLGDQEAPCSQAM